MNKEDLIYLAGFVDGEGCIFAASKKSQGSLIRDRHYYPALHIAQKYPAILHWIQEVVGQGKVTQRTDKKAYTYKISGSSCEALLIQLLPYLKGKHNQAKLAITLMAVDPEEGRAKIHKQLQLLKRKEGTW